MFKHDSYAILIARTVNNIKKNINTYLAYVLTVLPAYSPNATIDTTKYLEDQIFPNPNATLRWNKKKS